LYVTARGAALVVRTEAEKKIYAPVARGSNRQFLMRGDDLTFPVRVYPAGISQPLE
jgi:hypothetical protein